MNELDRYLFDLQGYLVIPNALDSETLAQLNAILDAKIEERAIPADAPHHRFPSVMEWSPLFRSVIDNPRVSPALEEMLGSKFRLDHDYLDIMRRGNGPTRAYLHGGGTPFDHSQFYRWDNGKMHSGLTVVGYNLRDVSPGDGGFACIPGSHKSNLPYPEAWRLTHSDPPPMQRVTGVAGTAILFTEALTHGTIPWTAEHERRTLFLKYSPNAISWSAHYYDASQYPELSERERAILEPPNARYATRFTPKDIG